MTPLNWENMALVGRIARAHGNRGQVIVDSETDFPEERFRVGGRLFVVRPDGPHPLTIASVRFQRGRPILGIAGVNTMDEAEGLARSELRVPREELTPLPPGTFYRHDLVGCRVETPAGESLGTVREVEGPAAVTRLVVAAAGRDVEIPLACATAVEVDPAVKRIIVNLPVGLLEL